MRREQRLKRRQDFSSVYREGEAFALGPLVIRVRQSDQTLQPRFGFAVGRRLGNAVHRNRLKRRLREAARRSGAEGNADIVVIARAQAMPSSYRQLEHVLWELLSRAGLRDADVNGSGRPS